jgi:hypothetical protein
LFFTILGILFDGIIEVFVEIFAKIAELKVVMLVKNMDLTSSIGLID